MKKYTCKRSIVLLLLIVFVGSLHAQSLSEKLARKMMEVWPDTGSVSSAKPLFRPDFLYGMAEVWQRTGNADYYRYIQHQIDQLADKNGTAANPITAVAETGRMALLLYRVTGLEKYYKTASQLHQQLKNQVDAINQSAPFYAEYAAVFNLPTSYNDVAEKLITLENRPTNNNFINPTETSQYGMALVDALAYFPENHPQQKALVAVLNRLAASIQKHQNTKTGAFQTNKPENQITAVSGRFIYLLAKGVRLGLLPEKYKIVAKKAYDGMVKQFVKTNADGTIGLKEKADGAALGTLLLAANEMELAEIPQTGKGQTVLLDSYFNNEFLKDVTGQTISFHYKWDEMDNNGFYFFKNVFNYRGVKTATLSAPPSAQNLKNAAIYILVDPDTPKETEKPNFVTEQDATALADWVKAGGVLAIFANDAGNCDLQHLNILTEKFGMHFNEDSRNKVTGNQFEMGALQIPATDPIFKTAKKVYIKEISTFKLSPPAVASFTDGKEVIIATAKYGKGTVFAVGDPWFYNEYTDGRKLPADFDNFKACQGLVNWLIKQIPAAK